LKSDLLPLVFDCLLLIILAGCFWGSMGSFVKRLAAFGFTFVQIVSIRVTLAALFFPSCCSSKGAPVFGSCSGDFVKLAKKRLGKNMIDFIFLA